MSLFNIFWKSVMWHESRVELPDEKVRLVRITLFSDLPTHHTPPTAPAHFQHELVSRNDTRPAQWLVGGVDHEAGGFQPLVMAKNLCR